MGGDALNRRCHDGNQPMVWRICACSPACPFGFQFSKSRLIGSAPMRSASPCKPPNISIGEHMKYSKIGLLSLFSGALLGASLTAGQASAARTQYPLTLENCGRQITIKHAPERTVAIGQSTTEILYILGLAEKVAGTAGWLGPVLKDYEDVNAKVKAQKASSARTSSSRNWASRSIHRPRIASARSMPAAATASGTRSSTWS
jgi:hypothetical protein